MLKLPVPMPVLILSGAIVVASQLPAIIVQGGFVPNATKRISQLEADQKALMFVAREQQASLSALTKPTATPTATPSVKSSVSTQSGRSK